MNRFFWKITRSDTGEIIAEVPCFFDLDESELFSNLNKLVENGLLPTDVQCDIELIEKGNNHVQTQNNFSTSS